MLKLSSPNISENAIASVSSVLRSGQLVHGTECEAFEQDLADYLGCKEVVLVSSGTAALHISLLALNIYLGDAVIVPDFTFPATANAIKIAGARPVIVDVDLETYTILPSKLEKTLRNWEGPETLKAVIPVHEFGCPAEMEEIIKISKKYNLFIVEDAACALGASFQNHKLGTLGDLGCFSFHPRKTLTTGEGGAIATNDPLLADRMRQLRNHGIKKTTEGISFVEPATNYRMTNFQAALGRCQLPELDDWIRKRKELAKFYLQLLAPLEKVGLLLLPKWKNGHSWQTFMVTLSYTLDRTQIIKKLREAGVESNLGAQSLTSLGIYGEQPVAASGSRLYKHGLALPLYERMSEADVQFVCSALREALI